MSKFDNVPVENDVTILVEAEAMLGEYPILYQQWVWDGIEAESIIFATEDVAGLEDDEILKIVKKSLMVKEDSEMTIKRVSGFCFVNFNFDTEETYLAPAKSA